MSSVKDLTQECFTLCSISTTLMFVHPLMLEVGQTDDVPLGLLNWNKEKHTMDRLWFLCIHQTTVRCCSYRESLESFSTNIPSLWLI